MVEKRDERNYAPPYDYEGGEDAWKDLGGQAAELSEASEDALYNIGLGKPEMRARVERRRRLAENAVQGEMNKKGAEQFREAAKLQDAARGVDINSPDYKLAELRAQIKRDKLA